jgi:hypothetical protein
MRYRKLLKELKKVNEVDYDSRRKAKTLHGWDGTLSYSGFKRHIYGVWHSGHNEQETNMIENMHPKAQKLYWKVIKKWSMKEMVKIRL